MNSKKKRRISGLALLSLILAFAAVLIGLYQIFFYSRGFVKTDAQIISVRQDPEAAADDQNYIVIVRYTAEGKEYTEVLDYYDASFEEGKIVQVLYDPADPAVVHSHDKSGLYMILAGVFILAVLLVSMLRTRRSLEALEQTRTDTVYAPSYEGTKRHLYYLTDRGTPKYGHHIEDQNRKVLYEAKMIRYTMLSPYSFDFIDHEHGRTVEHLIGHEESVEWDTLLIDNHCTFTFDGEDIWNHLKRNGIRIEPEFMDGKLLWPCWRIYRGNKEIAYAESSSVYVHEEDEEERSRVSSLLPVPGFYRIDTSEEYLDLVFVIMTAFARTGAADQKGGHYGLLFKRK